MSSQNMVIAFSACLWSRLSEGKPLDFNHQIFLSMLLGTAYGSKSVKELHENTLYFKLLVVIPND